MRKNISELCLFNRENVNALFLSAGSVNHGFLNTLKETPGTYPLKLWQCYMQKMASVCAIFSRAPRIEMWKHQEIFSSSTTVTVCSTSECFLLAEHHCLPLCCIMVHPVFPSPAVHSLISDCLSGTSVAVFLTLLHCPGALGVFLHPLVSGGSDWLPHLPDLSQPDHKWGCKCMLHIQLYMSYHELCLKSFRSRI